MAVLDNHVVVIRCPDHGFDLHLYLGRARAPDIPFHVHEHRFWRLVNTTRDPHRLIELMTRREDDALFD